VSNKPKVSVILAVYNAAQFLNKCIDSIINQTLNNIEIICVDDCSSDDSLAILHAYAEKDSRIKVIQQNSNRGAGAARNAGLEIANGEYLSFLDADDYFSSDMLKVSVEKADALSLDVFVFGSKAFNDVTGVESDMSWSIKETLLPETEVFSAEQIKEDFFQAFIWWAWDKIFRKEYIDKHGFKFQEIRTSNDLLFTVSAVLMADRISYTKEAFAVQRQKVESSLSNTRHLSYDCCLKATIALKDFMESADLYSRYERDFKNYALNFLIWNINTISQTAYVDLYNAVKQFYTTLNVSRDDVYYKPFYDTYLFIIEHCAEEYLFYLRMNLERDIEESHNQIASLEAKCHEAQNEIDEFIDRVEYLTSEAHSTQLTLDEIKAAKELLIGEHESIRTKYDTELAAREEKIAQQNELIATVIADATAKERMIESLLQSRSWQITSPLRWVMNKLR